MILSPSRRLAILCVHAVMAGCADPDPAADLRHSVERLENGGQRVVNFGGEAWTAETRWALTEEVEIGAADGSGPEVFGAIAALRVDGRDRIHVLDLMAQEIRVFDAAGAFLHGMGRRGRGPGELLGAETFFLASSGEVVVVDDRTARYSVFGDDGAFRAVHPRPLRGVTPFGGFLPDGRLVDWGLSFPMEGPEVVAGRQTLFEPFLVSGGWTVEDSLPPITLRRDMTPDGSRPQIFFAGRMVGCQDPTGTVWFGDPHDYEVVGRRPEGDTLVVFTLPTLAAPVTEEDRAMVRERLASRPQLAEEYLRGLPASKPVIRGVCGDGRGYVYVVPEDAEAAAGTVVDVLRESGVYLGRLRLPRPMRVAGGQPVFFVSPDHLHYVVADDLGVPRVVGVRIVRPG